MLLSNGNIIPAIGLGTWKSSSGKVKDAVIYAVKNGYRHIDCAHVYGNEKEIGEAFTELFDNNVVKRADLFITSKVWNTKHRSEDVYGALQTTLKNLNLDYLDLYLIHWPIAFESGENNFPKDENNNMIHTDTHYIDTWYGMEDVYKKNLVKAIGVSNFNIKQIHYILSFSSIPISVLQIECHFHLTQEKLVKFARDNRIVVTAYSPLGSPDRPWGKSDEPNLLEIGIIKNLAEKYNKSPAQILIKFINKLGLVVIPKSVTPSRISENIDILNFDISEEDMETLLDISHTNTWRACVPLSLNKDHVFYPFK